jgi:DNA modification methylase
MLLWTILTLPSSVPAVCVLMRIGWRRADCASDPTSGGIPMPAEAPKSAPLVVTYRSVDNLFPDARNARSHPKRQLDQIAASIRQFGFANPILIDSAGVIIAGHGRLLAAKALGLTEVPTITLAGLSDAQKRALRIADNKIALGAGWDIDLLKVELSELSVELDLSLTGFSTGELDVMLNRTDPDDEVIPAVPVEPRTRPGDIWIAGDHRIGCGDARDLAFLQDVMGPSTRADAAFLDPPYNVRINGHANARGRHREFAMASGEMSDEAFRAFLADTLAPGVSVSRDGAVHFICMDWRHMDDVAAVCKSIYGDLLNLCVWNKSNAGMGSLYRSKHELVFVYRVGKAPHFNAVELGRHGRHRTNVWDYTSVNSMAGSRREDLALHPTVKPTALVADAIQDVTRRGEVVLDIFLGSGTTLIAAERTVRRFRGVELDPAYVDVALERWSAMTGREPRLAEQGVKA